MDEVLSGDFEDVLTDEEAPSPAPDLFVHPCERSFHSEAACPSLARVPVPTVSVLYLDFCERDVDRLAADKTVPVDPVAKFRREAKEMRSWIS